MKSKPFALFLDQLACHKSKVSNIVYRQLNISPILNVSYSPEYNPIETAFSQVKHEFKRNRLNALANHDKFVINQEIKKAFGVITPRLIDNCAKRSYALLKSDII